VVTGFSLVLGGAVITLAHHQVTPQSHSDAEIKERSTQSVHGTIKNGDPSVSASVNGKPVPVKQQGTTSIPTDHGTATITVNGNTVTTRSESNTPGSMSVSVQSDSRNGNGSSSSSSYQSSTSNSNSSFSSSSSTSVSSSGSGSVRVQTDP
jgi:hypothetical protein